MTGKAFDDPDLGAVALEIKRVGDQLGVVLPDDFLARTRLKEGDKLHLTEQPDGSLRLSPFESDYARTMEIAEKVMNEYRETFITLAK